MNNRNIYTSLSITAMPFLYTPSPLDADTRTMRKYFSVIHRSFMCALVIRLCAPPRSQPTAIVLQNCHFFEQIDLNLSYSNFIYIFHPLYIFVCFIIPFNMRARVSYARFGRAFQKDIFSLFFSLSRAISSSFSLLLLHTHSIFFVPHLYRFCALVKLQFPQHRCWQQNRSKHPSIIHNDNS